MRLRSVGSGLAAAAFVAFAAPADAAPTTARTSSLAWVRADGAEQCIGGKALAESVERILGRRVFVSASVADVAVEGRVEKSAAGWKATLRVSDDHGAVLGDREIASAAADCRAMDDSLAFVIAVMIDPDAAASPPPPLAPRRAPAPAPSPAPPPRRWTIAPEVGVSAAFGPLPSPALGATVSLRVGPPLLGVRLLGAYYPGVSEAVAGSPGASANFTWAYAGGALCSRVARVASLSAIGCAGALAGVTIATPQGLGSEQGSVYVAAVGTVRARVEWRIVPILFLAAEGALDVPFVRPSWTASGPASDEGTVFQPSVVGGEATLALGFAIE